ncbi:MAG TPA: hypothetical protein GXZ78_08785 [Eubacteriaceae bacterium]|jgi:hypothetical protein|nr:hypothetical protein [Eubacteriaceae bacterium]
MIKDSNEQLRKEIEEIQNLILQIDQNEIDNKEIVQMISNKCSSIKMNLPPSDDLNEDREKLYSIETEINKPLDEFTNLV